MVERRDTGWSIIGLIDWGDSRIGPRSHDLLSPNINTFLGERDVLLAWHASYRTMNLGEPRGLEHLLMTRSLLYYAEDFGSLLRRVSDARDGQCWDDIARTFWHLTTGS